MIISIPSKIDELSGNGSHKRHLYESFLKLPKEIAEVGVDLEKYDFAFDRNIYYFLADPHGLANDQDPRLIIDEEIKKLLPIAGYKITEFDDLDVVMKRRYPDLFLTKLLNDQPHIKAVMFFAQDPFNEIIGKKLKYAKMIPAMFLPPSWIFNGDPTSARKIDVYWRGCLSSYYPLRVLMCTWLRNHAKFHGWNYHEVSYEQNLFEKTPADFDIHQGQYASELRNSKIMCLDNTIFNYPVAKMFEAMACGVMVMSPMPRDAERLGLIDGVNMVSINWDNFQEKLRYYLTHDEERIKIATAGQKITFERNTSEASALSIAKQLKELL